VLKKTCFRKEGLVDYLSVAPEIFYQEHLKSKIAAKISFLEKVISFYS